jgi:hypothetical protein
MHQLNLTRDVPWASVMIPAAPASQNSLSHTRWVRLGCLPLAYNCLHQPFQICICVHDPLPLQCTFQALQEDLEWRTSYRQSAKVNHICHPLVTLTYYTQFLERQSFVEAEDMIVSQIMSKVFNKVVRKQWILLQSIHKCVLRISKNPLGYSCCNVPKCCKFAALVRCTEEGNSVRGISDRAVNAVEFGSD